MSKKLAGIQRLKDVLKYNQRGVALVVTLFVMLVLMLVSMSIFLQSDSEFLIAVNEQDSLKALSDAEAALQWTKRKVIDYANTPGNADFSDLLNGPDNADASDDNMLGLGDLSLTQIDNVPVDTSEKTKSAKVQKNFGDGTFWYEAFRLGVDLDGDDIYDGNTRTFVYVRIHDNYDPNKDLTDTDLRIHATVVTEYPVVIDSSGNKVDLSATRKDQVRGVAKRRLETSFGPTQQKAILTDGTFDLQGSVEVCGACGGAHANETLSAQGGGNLVSCTAVTGFQDFELTGSPRIAEGSGFGPYVPIPVINPYDDIFVPTPATFDHSTDTEFDAPANVPELKCPAWDPVTNPGGTKYFALVIKKVSGQDYAKVYKAYYWDPDGVYNNDGDEYWAWRLIDDKINNTDRLDTLLDNCGRVVSGTVDENEDGTVETLAADIGVTGGGVVDGDTGGNSEFYGFSTSGRYNLGTCTTDDTLSSTTKNDFVQSASPATFPTYNWDGATATLGANSRVDVPALPGTVLAATPPADSTADFVPADMLVPSGGQVPQWSAGSNTVYAPLYNAYIFVFGNLEMSGNLGNLALHRAGATTSIDLPNARWRATFITFGNIKVTGTPAYAPAHKTMSTYVLVAGRDIELGGNVSGDAQDVCDPNNCFTALPASIGFEGAIVAHEQIYFHGNPGVNGFIIAEDAARCSDAVDNANGGISSSQGNVSIYYDCVNPPYPWPLQGTRMASWREVQVF